MGAYVANGFLDKEAAGCRHRDRGSREWIIPIADSLNPGLGAIESIKPERIVPDIACTEFDSKHTIAGNVVQIEDSCADHRSIAEAKDGFVQWGTGIENVDGGRRVPSKRAVVGTVDKDQLVVPGSRKIRRQIKLVAERTDATVKLGRSTASGGNRVRIHELNGCTCVAEVENRYDGEESDESVNDFDQE